MSSPTKPLLVVFLGFPGSGKTYFAKRLAAKLGAVTLNSDALRIEMFGSTDNIENIRATDESRLYSDVFNAMLPPGRFYWPVIRWFSTLS